MLQCSMHADRLKLSLEDVLADLWHARRQGDFGRLVLLAYSDLRRWALAAGQQVLAQHSREFVLSCPYPSRHEFLSEIDRLIDEAERAHASLPSSA
jgi:hypothetical protein